MYPSLTDLVELARQGKIDELLLGFAKRIDTAETVKFLQAERALEWLGKKKATVTEARIAGETAGEVPETPDWFADALVDLAVQRDHNNSAVDAYNTAVRAGESRGD